MTGRKHLTHLTAWRAFEAATRHSSFVLAARELSVTPAAVSQQVRTLEGYLGVTLFIRTKRGVTPTAAAAAILPELTAALDHLNRTIARLRRRRSGDVVTVTVPPSFAVKWLMPRLERFRERHPGIDVRIDTTERLVDFEQEDIDLGVRYGSGQYPGVEAELLLEERVFPVCTPDIARELGEPVTAQSLARATLIHDATIRFNDAFPTWQTWMAHMHGAPRDLDVTRGLHVNSSVLAIEAANSGQGLLLGRSVIVADDIADGRLVRPHGDASMSGCSYYVVHAPGAMEHGHVRAFRDWLRGEAAGTSDMR